MFFLTKLLPLFTLPTFAINSLLAFAIIKNKRRLALFLIISLWFLSTNFIGTLLFAYLETPWVRIDSKMLPEADAIVVLSGGNIFLRGNNRYVEWDDPDRFFGGVELFKNKKAPLIIFTGEKVEDDILSGHLYKKESLKLGIPIDSIKTTGLTLNTYQEALEVRRIFPNIEIPKIILVTSAYHLSRARKVFERQKFNVVPYPVDFYNKRTKNLDLPDLIKNPYNWFPNAYSLSISSKAIREIYARIIYKI
tara:strand:- start:1968 stop:2717 length:750 start_codon:yes stop_codon:yes gene_type:complete